MSNNSDGSDRKDNAVFIHQLLEELQTQISILEEQIETSLFSAQSKIDSAEGAMLKENSPALKDSFVLTGWR